MCLEEEEKSYPKMQGLLPISVVVCVKNVQNIIESCLKSVKANNPSQLIVVDGLSTDKTLEIARRYCDDFCTDAGKGPSVAHQLGAEKSHEEYIAYVDSDVILPDGALGTMLRELRTLGYDCIAARIRGRGGTSFWERSLEQHVDMCLEEGTMHLNATLLVRKSALAIGFDPFIRVAGDDRDFLSRLRKLGYRAALSSAWVYHSYRADFKSFVNQALRNGRSNPAMLWKHGLLNPSNARFWPPLTTLYRTLFCLARRKMKLSAYFMIRGFFESLGFAVGLVELTRMRSQGEKLPRPRLW